MNSLEGVMVVGLTGQTGAGKTTVCKIFSENGFSIINADHVARQVMEKGQPCLKEICEFFGINPYELISSGSMLMAAADGNLLVNELKKAGIPATIIGKATAGNDRVLLNEDERRFLEPPKTDELYKVV